MKYKWNLNNNKRCLKIHIVIDANTKKIFSNNATNDEGIHDIKSLPELVENIIKSGSMTTTAVIANYSVMVFMKTMIF